MRAACGVRFGTALRLSGEHGLAQLLLWAKPWHGWTQVKLGRRAEGIAEIREGLATLQAMGTGRLFGPGTPTSDLVEYIRSWFAEHAAQGA